MATEEAPPVLHTETAALSLEQLEEELRHRREGQMVRVPKVAYEAMVAALEFYGNLENHKVTMDYGAYDMKEYSSRASRDGGQVAQAALTRLRQES